MPGIATSARVTAGVGRQRAASSQPGRPRRVADAALVVPQHRDAAAREPLGDPAQRGRRAEQQEGGDDRAQ